MENRLSIKFCKNIRNIIFSIIAIVCLGIFVDSEGSYDKVYILTLSVTFLSIILYVNHIYVPKQFICLIPLIFFCVWLYGFFIGILRHNQFQYVMRNFSGMTVYLFFYFYILYQIDVYRLTKMLIRISFLFLFLTLIAYITTFVFHNNIFFYIPFLNSFQSAGTIEYFSRELIYISLSVTSYKLFFQHNYSFKYILTIILIFIVEFFCIQSGGDCLAAGVIFFIIFVCSAVRRPNINVWGIILLAIIALLGFIMINGLSKLFVLFSHQDKGNMVRYAQIEYIITKGRTFWGHGLGAIVNPDKWHGYAIEVVYLNIYHKFGVFSILIYFCYLYTFIAVIKELMLKEIRVINAVPLGCFGYCISALANPLLFAPQNVILHTIALYIIYLRNNNEHFINRNEFL